MTKNEAINIIVKCAKIYEQNLKGKSLLFIYLDNFNNINQIETIFSKSNFQHLTGVEVINRKTVKSFYDKCLKKVISAKEIKLKKDGTTELKLSILEPLMNINKNAKMIGNYNCSKVCLYTEKIVGTVHASLGLKKVNEYYVPNTALKEDIRDIVDKPNKIVCIMEKTVEQKLYSNITYINKNININEMLKNSDIASKIDLDAIYSK